MTDQGRMTVRSREPVPIRSCWLCGIRLSGGQMVPDGGSACPDLRWYCRDIRACTQRWTSHAVRLAATRQGTAKSSKTSETWTADVADVAAARPVPV